MIRGARVSWLSGRRPASLLLCLLLLAQSSLVCAAARAWLDRDRIELGETVTLNVQIDGAGASTPDFSALDADFQLLGTSSSSQISISNGQRTASTLFAVALEPRREGVITVPALSINGDSTTPLVLTVAPSSVATTPDGDLFVEVEAAPLNPYVQQQVIYTLRLFYAITVLDGQLQEPAPTDARVTRLGTDRTYQVERAGRRYSVVERRFAVVPERSGELRLDPPRFNGRGMDRNGLGGMFGGGIRLNTVGQEVVLQVRATPAKAARPWLPASQLRLDNGEQVLPDSAKVGEPITLSLRLSARGLSAEQLPELTLPSIDGATVYPDQESTRDSSDGDELAAVRERRFAIVPTRPGELVIPELLQSWWNVDSDQAETARLPERRIRIAATVGTDAASGTEAGSAATPGSVPAQSGEAKPAVAPVTGISMPVWSNPWMWLSGILALAWASREWLRRRSPPTQAPVLAVAAPRRADPQRLREALAGGDLADIALALRASAPPGAGPGLDSVAAYLIDQEQHAAVLLLDRCLYGPGGNDELCRNTLRAAFRQPPRWRVVRAAAAPEDLPPLYR